MSNHRAIAAVTATLKHMISHALAGDDVLAGAIVTARPPDRARHGHAGNQVNLFLYHTSIAASWRNQDPPGFKPGEAVHPPLPLELSYLVSVYGDNDDEVLSGRLLGLAVSLLHDHPLLSTREIGDSLKGSELEHQVERVRITPHPIPLDEVSRLWSTFGTGYRISVSYRAAVVLIDSTRPVAAPLPVLARGAGDTGPHVVDGLVPQIDLAVLPRGQHAVRAGELITLHGRSLDRVAQVRISGIRLPEPVLRAPVTVTASTLTVSVPESPALPAGTVALTPLYDDGAGSGRLLPGNDVLVGLAPSLLTNSPVKAKLDAGAASVQVRCKPAVLAGQTIGLVVGDRVVSGKVAPPGSSPREKLSFALKRFASGTYTLRLRVDGQDSIPVRPPAGPAEPALQLDPRAAGGADVTWEAENGDYLTAGLEWLRACLGLGSSTRPEPFWDAPRWSNPPTRPALELLGDRFAMSRFERLVLLLVCAPELDPNFLGRLAGAGRGAYPTFALALDALPEPVWEVVATHRPLRYWRMLEIHRPAGEPLITSRLQADDRVVNFVKGLNLLDERLARRLISANDAAAELSPSQELAVDRALECLQADGRPPAIQLLGRDAIVRRCVAARAALRAGLDLFELHAERIPADTADLTDLLLLWRRESQLLPLALYVDLADTRPQDAGAAQALLEDAEGALFVGVREPWPLARRRVRLIDAARPTAAEQQALWRDALRPGTGDPVQLADEFDVNHLVIHDVARQGADPESLWAACRAQTRPRLDALAQRVEPVATWDDLVLGDETRMLLQHLVEQVRGRPTVLREWGFGERIRRGTAITALFAGQSGTGKTLAAEVIAGELELDLYRIDLSGVVSKYIGETERNLRRVFDAAEEGGALLFFDEADALFGKRSEVKDSHDRYANIEINYLLQRMEDYRGVAILASNRRQALDEAFLRRLRFVVTFPFPSQLEREALWARAFPPPTPTDELDVARLAALAATGGMIRNIALNAASCAAGRGGPVTMELVLAMAGIEFRKNELPVNDADFRPRAVHA